MYNNSRRQRVLCEKYNSKWKSSTKNGHHLPLAACARWCVRALDAIEIIRRATRQLEYMTNAFFRLLVVLSLSGRETRTSEGGAYSTAVPGNESIRCSCVNWRNFHSIARPHFLSFVAFRRTFYRKLNVKHWIWMIFVAFASIATVVAVIVAYRLFNGFKRARHEREWIF